MDADLDVLVVGADALARSVLAHALADQPGVRVRGSVAPGEPRELLLTWEPAVLLWDAGLVPGDLPDLGDLDVPTVAVVSDAEQAVAASSAGAAGILFRDGDGVRMRAALLAVLQGLRVVDAAFAADLLADRSPPEELAEPLTPREHEVLRGMAAGLTNREIAGALEISVHTAKFHVNAILGKLDATTRTEAVVQAARMGLLSDVRL